MKTLSVILREADKVSKKILEDFEPPKSTREFNFRDGAIIGLLEDMIAKIKSLKVLLEAECYDSNDLISRSIFESHLYLKFILQQDTEIRAKLYAYQGKVKDLKLIDDMKAKNKVGREIRSFLRISIEDIEGMVLKNSDPDYPKRIKKIYKNLRDEKFEKKVWYDIDGKTSSIEQLSIKMGMQREYEIIYRLLFKEVHSSNALSRIRVSKNEVRIGKFDIDPTLNISLCSLFLMESTRDILSYYGLKGALTIFNVNIGTNYSLNKM